MAATSLGCVRVPRVPVVVGSTDTPVPSARLPDLLRVVVWNVRKGTGTGFDAALRAHMHHAPDLLLLQEVCLDRHTEALIEADAHSWRFAPSWIGYGPLASRTFGCRGDAIPTGVLTASRVPPVRATPLRATAREPMSTPKLALLTEFAIEARHDTLLVANVHGLLLRSPGTFRRELARLLGAIRGHQGPLLLAGDFNTWSGRRLTLLDDAATGIGMRAADLSSARRRAGTVAPAPLDHVYVRDLVVVAVEVSPDAATGASDHDAITVTLRSTTTAPP